VWGGIPPLLALGCKDPVARLSEIKARGPERQRMLELFTAWWTAHADTPIRVSELAPEVKEIADRAIGNLTGARQGGFVLERFGAQLPQGRRVIPFADCGQTQVSRVIRRIRKIHGIPI
jgi:hypothetical protein